jgi:hypothetical protein
VTNPITIRPTGSLVLAFLTLLIDILFLIQVGFFGDGTWLTQVGVVLVTATLCWLLFIKPKVVVFDEGITIVNPTMTASFGWDEVDEIETRFGLTIESGKAKVVAWAAPAPGRYRRRTVHSQDVKGIAYDKDFGLRPGDLPNSHSGAAAHIARSRRAAFKRGAAAAPIVRHAGYDKLGLTILGCSLCVLVAGLMSHV